MEKKNGVKSKKMMLVIIAILVLLIISLGAVYMFKSAKKPQDTKQYSSELERRIAQQLSNDTNFTGRADYLPSAMFSRLPEMPEDFFRVRILVRTGRIDDISSLNSSYWLQPEFFPHFEDIGLPLLQNPDPNRWGAYGIAVYPSDSVAGVKRGNQVEAYFLIKSSYLVETTQGINLVPIFPQSASITTGYSMPDGSNKVEQDPAKVKDYFKVTVDPGLFILEPNFPVFNVNGTRLVKLTVEVLENAPLGNYIIGLDTDNVPADYEKNWTRQYLNRYVSGSNTKLDRPYYQLFLAVERGDN